MAGAAEAAQAWAIGDATTMRGFRVGGFRVVTASSVAEAAEALVRAREGGARLVVLTETLAAALDDTPTPLAPLVAVVPSASGARARPRPGEALAQDVRRALGLASR